MHTKTRVNMSITNEVAEKARELGINASAAAEDGLRRAIKAAREEAWRRESAGAICEHNERVSERGTLLTPEWVEPDR